MIDRFEILASKIRYLVSRNRWSARLLGYRPVEEHRDDPGLVLVQIDGLGMTVLRRAMATGKMPFLRHLVGDEGHAVRSLYSGMASNTPNVQGELFYGMETVVPGFGFIDRETGREMTMNAFADTAAIERRIAARGDGLLRGGSAWSDVFTGGAAESHLCASTTGVGNVVRALNPVRILALLVWHGWSVVRVLANFVIELGLAVTDFVRGTIAGRRFRAELRFIGERVAVTAVMREIVTAGACIDAERGLPIIHLNFLGYDEHAHRRGPDSRFAVWTLRGIDRSLRRIWLAAHRSPRRDYQVWVYSDHGQERVQAYRRLHGEDVTEAVDRAWRSLEERGAGDGAGGAVPSGSPRPPALAHASKSGRSRWLGWERFARVPDAEDDDGSERGHGKPHVVHRGPVGFVYLPEGTSPERTAALGRAVAGDAGVPMVLACDGDGAKVWTPGAPERRLPDDTDEIFGDRHPHRRWIAQDTLRIVQHESAGHLVLLGWNRDGAVSFKSENGAHGSAGPRETSAFVVLPPETAVRVRADRVLRPSGLRTLVQDLLDPATAHIALRRSRCREERADEALAAGETPLRLMTYNVHGCRGMDGRFSTQRIARVIARSCPDVVCLQELDQSRRRSGGVDQVHEIAELLQKEFHFHAVAEIDDGLFGNAVLSSLPISVRSSGPLPRIESRINLAERGVLWVEVNVNGTVLQVLNTHLSIHERERRIQTRELVERWLGDTGCRPPVVLAGDFNASGDSHIARHIERVLSNTVPRGRGAVSRSTWSSRIPMRQIDHVFASADVSVRDVIVPRSRLSQVASDHLPLVVDLRLPA
jgi:endonuclease/exonuclease/phosphatase family metal-dependent hydrolase